MVVKLPGSKGRYLRTLAPYLAWLTEGGDDYGEACVGGGSVLIHVAENNPQIRLFANDLDPLIAAFWNAVSDDRMVNELCAMLAIPPTREERAALLAREPESTLEQARAAVVAGCLRTTISTDLPCATAVTAIAGTITTSRRGRNL